MSLNDGTWEIAYRLLRVARELAPSGKAQAAIAKIYNDEKAQGANERQVCLRLNAIILDGLSFGDWPGHSDWDSQRYLEDKTALAFFLYGALKDGQVYMGRTAEEAFHAGFRLAGMDPMLFLQRQREKEQENGSNDE